MNSPDVAEDGFVYALVSLDDAKANPDPPVRNPDAIGGGLAKYFSDKSGRWSPSFPQRNLGGE